MSQNAKALRNPEASLAHTLCFDFFSLALWNLRTIWSWKLPVPAEEPAQSRRATVGAGNLSALGETQKPGPATTCLVWALAHPL